MNIEDRLKYIETGELPKLSYFRKEIDEDGTQKFYNENGQLHRDNDLPAIIRADGTQFWYHNGELIK